MLITPSTTCRLRVTLAVFVVSFIVLAGITFAWGPGREPDLDSPQYLAIAQNLAGGKGFVNSFGPWPDRPSYDRMPAWPAVLAAALWVAPGAPPQAVARFAAALCLAVAGALFSLLSCHLGVRPGLSMLAGFGVSLSPPLVYLSVSGMSEPSLVMFVAAALVCVFAGGRWFWLGTVLLGVGPLVRTQLILVPAAFAVILVWSDGRRLLAGKQRRGRFAIALALAYLLPFLWTLRNYSLTGRFPLLSSIEGETLYGANNPVVANDLENWGYWVMPNEIPGETPKLDLAKTGMTDLELNDYYHRKGIVWIKQNIPALPRLVLGKLIRGFVPVPWKPKLGSFFAFSYRLLLDALYLALLPFWWRSMDRIYLRFCLAMFAVQLLATVIYYGASRFTHVYVEILFVPCIVFGVQQWRARAAEGAVSRLIRIDTY